MKSDWFWIAYGRGAHASSYGDDLSINPYAYGSGQYDAWRDGYKRNP